MDFRAVVASVAAQPAFDWGNQARNFAAECDAREIRQLIALVEQERSPVGDVFLLVSLRRWGELEGEAAFAYADAAAGGDRIARLEQVLQAWAVRAPTEAWNILRELSANYSDRRYELGFTLATIAGENLPLAIMKFQEVAPERQCLECLARNLISVAYSRGDARVVWQAVLHMPAGEHRAALRDMYWRAVGEYEGSRGWNEASSLVDETDRSAAELHLMSGWAEVDFPASFEWAANLSSPLHRDAALGEVLQSWGRGARSSEVAEVIARLPDDFGEKAALGMAWQFANLNPTATMKWGESLTSNALREEMQRRVMKAWTTLEPEAALDYIRAQTDLEIRGILLWSFIFQRVDNHTFSNDDLDEIVPAFARDWKVRLLKRLVVVLVDPSSQANSFVILADFAAKISGREDLTRTEKQDILKPMGFGVE